MFGPAFAQLHEMAVSGAKNDGAMQCDDAVDRQATRVLPSAQHQRRANHFKTTPRIAS